MSFSNVNSLSTSFFTESRTRSDSNASSVDGDTDTQHARFTDKYKQQVASSSNRVRKIELGNLLPEDRFEKAIEASDVPTLHNNENPILGIKAEGKSDSLSQSVMKSPEEFQQLALEHEKGTREAKQHLFNVGLGVGGAALMGMVAQHVTAAQLPMLFVQALTPLMQLFNSVSQLLTNKHALPAIKGMAHSFCSTAASVLGFGKKKAVTFGGGGQSTARGSVQKTSSESVKGVSGGNSEEKRFKQLLTEYYGAVSTFLQAAESTTDPSLQMDAAESMQRAMIGSSTNFILLHGTDEERKKVQAIQKFQRDYEAYVNGIPDGAKLYKDLPLATQNRLRQLIQDTLTSEVKELVYWGQMQAQAIGMTPGAIEKVMESKKLTSAVKF